MQLSHLRIHEIVNVDGLPSYARGSATFANGQAYEFYANFAHGYGDECVIIRRATDRRRRMTQTDSAAAAIRERLGFAEIAERERNAIAGFEHERVTACQNLIASPAS